MLSGLRIPGVSGSSRTRGKDLLGYDGREDDKLTKRRVVRSLTEKRRALGLLLGITIATLFIFWRRYELHIEIQVFSRGWIKDTILPTPPLSSTCFAPSAIARSSYPADLAQAPSFVELHAGLGMTLGNDCYNFASTIPRSPLPEMALPKHTVFHTYWRSDLLPLGPRQIALFNSLLATQDRQSTSVILWINSASTAQLEAHPMLSPLLKRYGQRFTIRSVDKKELAGGTPMEGHQLLEMADAKAWLDGDLVRILVLWAQGGIWVDMDTIMTGRDMRVLGESEWVTQWDCYDKVYVPLNGAMMHFLPNSPYLCEMLYAMAHDPPPKKGTTDWGSRLYHKVWRRLVENGITPFKILPYCFTDGQTCRLDNRLPDPFAQNDQKWGQGRVAELRKKVGSVWAVHLHNQWKKEFPKDGWVQSMILNKVDEAVRRYRPVEMEEPA